jgi:hypothetical protein
VQWWRGKGQDRTARSRGEKERVFSGMVAVWVRAEDEDTAAAGSNGRGAEAQRRAVLY